MAFKGHLSLSAWCGLCYLWCMSSSHSFYCVFVTPPLWPQWVGPLALSSHGHFWLIWSSPSDYGLASRPPRQNHTNTQKERERQTERITLQRCIQLNCFPEITLQQSTNHGLRPSILHCPNKTLVSRLMYINIIQLPFKSNQKATNTRSYDKTFVQETVNGRMAWELYQVWFSEDAIWELHENMIIVPS